MIAGTPILIHVQHLLGIGHLRRAMALAKALIENGAQVTLVSGGPEVPDLSLPGGTFVQLDPIRAEDSSFARMVDKDGNEVTPELEARRTERLLALYDEVKPRVIITELFPLGRRRLRFELIPLLDKAKIDPNPPLILSSVRDILVRPRKEGRADECIRLTETYYDHILVHSDPALVPLTASFPEVEQIEDRLAYTGFVVQQSPETSNDMNACGEILVSAGGGAEGDVIYSAVLNLLSTHPETGGKRLWRMLVGWNVPDETFDRYQKQASQTDANLIVERARPDFPALLKSCDLSISQAGYNTVMELLSAGTKSVLIPFVTNSETEQETRASHLQSAGRVHMVHPNDLTAHSLADAIKSALGQSISTETPNLSGDRRAAELIGEWVEARP